MVWQFVMTAVIIIAVVLLPFVLLYLRRRWLTGQGGLFALLHVFNIFVGQSVAATIQQLVFAFLVGSVFYATRRVTGFSETSTMRARPCSARCENEESGGFVAMSGQAQETSRAAGEC